MVFARHVQSLLTKPRQYVTTSPIFGGGDVPAMDPSHNSLGLTQFLMVSRTYTLSPTKEPVFLSGHPVLTRTQTLRLFMDDPFLWLLKRTLNFHVSIDRLQKI